MKLLNKKQLREMTSLSIQTITRLEKAGNFPLRVKLPPDFFRVAWVEEEVRDWLHVVVQQDRAS